MGGGFFAHIQHGPRFYFAVKSEKGFVSPDSKHDSSCASETQWWPIGERMGVGRGDGSASINNAHASIIVI